MSPEHFRQFAESIRDPLLLVTSSGMIVALNQGAGRLLNLREADATGRPLSDLFADSPEKVRSYLAAASRTRQPLFGALYLGSVRLKAEGGLVTPSSNGQPALILLKLQSGEQASSRFAALNERIGDLVLQIRERREAERLLAAQNRLLELAVQDEPLPVILEGLVRLAEQESAEEMLASILLMDAKGTNLVHGAAPSLPPEYSRAIDGIEIGPSVGSCGTAAFTRTPVIVTDIGKDPLWANFRDLALSFGLRSCWSTPIFSQGGAVLGTFAMYYRNVRSPSQRDQKLIDLVSRTAAVAIERARAVEEIRFQAVLLDAVDEAVIATDPEGRVVYWNRFAEQLYGWSQEEALGKHIVELTRAEPADAETVMRRVQSGESWSGEFLMRDRKGTIFPAHVTDSPIHDAAGRLIGVVGISFDISARKEAEQERARLLESEQAARQSAERASRLKDEFLATVSHELRTPLTAVLGWSRILLTDPSIQGENRHAIETIERSSRQQAQLIDELLDVSRIITGKLRLQSRRIDLEEVLGQVIETVRHSAEARGIRIERDAPSSPSIIFGDPERLQQVFWNLLSNAIKFSPRNSRVQVLLRASGSSAEVVVTDQGEGIAEPFLPYIFDRFSQEDGSSSRTHGGLGLGLSIAKHLIEIHGGSIHAESAGRGKGAIFTVRLPVMAIDRPEEPRATASATIAAVPQMRGLRVLIAEDDAASRQMLSALFTRCGADVFATASTAEALAAFEANDPHILISDIAMPGSDGYELIRLVRESERARGREMIPAIALTAQVRAEDRMHVLRAGFQMHVPKPVDPEELLTVVSTLARLDAGGFTAP